MNLLFTTGIIFNYLLLILLMIVTYNSDLSTKNIFMIHGLIELDLHYKIVFILKVEESKCLKILIVQVAVENVINKED